MSPTSLLRNPALRHYGLGLASVVVGAGLTTASGSMLPLAMGSAAAILCTAQGVKAIRQRAAARRKRRTGR